MIKKVNLKCRGDKTFTVLFTWNDYLLVTKDLSNGKPFVIHKSSVRNENK